MDLSNRTPPHQGLLAGDVVIDQDGEVTLIRCIETSPPPGVEPGWRIEIHLSGLFKGHDGRMNEALRVFEKVLNIYDYLPRDSVGETRRLKDLRGQATA